MYSSSSVVRVECGLEEEVILCWGVMWSEAGKGVDVKEVVSSGDSTIVLAKSLILVSLMFGKLLLYFLLLKFHASEKLALHYSLRGASLVAVYDT